MHTTTAEKKKYIVRAGMFAHRGNSVHKPGSILFLTEAEAAPNIHQLEPFENYVPPPPPVPEDMTKREYVVCPPMVVWRGDVMYKGGESVFLTDREFFLHKHQVQPVANYVPPAPPVPDDPTRRTWRVKGGFFIKIGELHYAGGALLLLTDREAAPWAAQIERADGAAPSPGSPAPRVTRAVRPARSA